MGRESWQWIPSQGTMANSWTEDRHMSYCSFRFTFWKVLGRGSLIKPWGSLLGCPWPCLSSKHDPAGHTEVSACPCQGWRASLFTSLGFTCSQHLNDFGLEDPMRLASWHHLDIGFPLWPSTYSDFLARATGDTLDRLQIPSGAGWSLGSSLSALNQRPVESPAPCPLDCKQAIWGSEPWVTN